MAKKQKDHVADDVEIIEVEETTVVAAGNSVKSVKAAKETKKPTKKDKGPRKSLGKRIKEIFSELKKVSWPTFGKVVKKTGVVILVVLIATIILFGFDQLFMLLYNLLTGVVS